jgi:hypothetical protein
MGFVLVASAWAQPQGVEITGRVTGRAGDAKGLASVTLEGNNRYVAMTNSRGDFRIQKVIPGAYLVTVSQGNFVQRFNIRIQSGPLNLNVGW